MTKYNELLSTWTDKLQTTTIDWTPKVIAALAILIVGYLLAKTVTRLVYRALDKSNVDETLAKFLKNIVYIMLMAFVVIAMFGKLGVDTTSIAAIFAAAGLAIGLALQGFLGNFASGVMIILNRPFVVDHYIAVAGVEGSVKAVGIFSTSLLTPDNKTIVVPNGNITSDNIINYTANKRRRLDLIFGIGYDDDLKKAKDLFTQLVKSESRILSTPAPIIAVKELGESSVNFAVRVWVKTENYWNVHFALTEAVKLACDEAGISIPFPQRDVHLHQAA